MSWSRRLAAITEIAGVFICGTLAARFIARQAGISSIGLRDLPASASIDFLALAWSTGANLVLRYGIVLALAFGIGWWHRRRALRDYGVTAARLSLRAHLAIAVVLFAVGGLLPGLLKLLRGYVDLGDEPRHWQMIEHGGSWEFWIYMAVSSYVLVPIVEELFARGYIQTRLSEDFGAPAAIVMTALMFTLSHRQYFIASAMGIGMLLALFFSSLIGGYARHHFGTIWPGVIGHAIGNIPFRGWTQPVLLVAMLIVIIAARRIISKHLVQLGHLLRSRGLAQAILVAIAAIVAILAIAAAVPRALLFVGIAAIAIAVVLEAREKISAFHPSS